MNKRILFGIGVLAVLAGGLLLRRDPETVIAVPTPSPTVVAEATGTPLPVPATLGTPTVKPTVAVTKKPIVKTVPVTVRPAPVGYATLLFAGNVTQPQINQLNAVYSGLPAIVRSRAITVNVLTPYPGPNGTVGYLNANGSEIVMNGAYGLQEAFGHEMGHFVQYHLLGNEKEQQWRTFWESHQSVMPTAYSRQSAAEGFAEVFQSRYGAIRRTLNVEVRREIESYFK
jgi:hypothetical protein